MQGTDYLMLELALYAVVAVYALYRHRLLVREVEASAARTLSEATPGQTVADSTARPDSGDG